MNAPTVAQMLNRSNAGHHRVLRSVVDDVPYVTASTTSSDANGIRTCVATLNRWGCLITVRVDHGGHGRDRYEYQSEITTRGVALLESLDARATVTVR